MCLLALCVGELIALRALVYTPLQPDWDLRSPYVLLIEAGLLDLILTLALAAPATGAIGVWGLVKPRSRTLLWTTAVTSTLFFAGFLMHAVCQAVWIAAPCSGVYAIAAGVAWHSTAKCKWFGQQSGPG